MRTRKRDRHNLIKVGAFISGLTLVLMVMIASIGKENSFFESKADIRARVKNVSNLKPGSYVELKGIRVGTVSSIDIVSEDEVEVVMNVLESELKWIKQDSQVTISNAGLVGDKFIEIRDGSRSAPPLDPKKDTLNSLNDNDLKSFLNKGESIASVTNRILGKLDQILVNLDNGNRIVETVNSIHKASQNLEKVSSDLREAKVAETVKNVNSSMLSLNRASSSLEKILTRIEGGPGTMNSLIYDDALHEDLRALLGGAQRNKVIKYFIRESIKNSERKKDHKD